MKPLAIGLVITMAGAAVVRADVAVPPPQGKKFVAAKHSVKLDKGVTGYVFFTRTLGLRNGSWAKIELSTDKAIALTAFGKFGLQLLAVPDATAKKYPTEKELLAALSEKMDGAASARFGPTALLPEKDERKELAIEHIVTGFDPKKGIQMKGDKPADKEEEAFAPTGMAAVMSGLALAAAFATGGLWLARRRKIG